MRSADPYQLDDKLTEILTPGLARESNRGRTKREGRHRATALNVRPRITIDTIVASLVHGCVAGYKGEGFIEFQGGPCRSGRERPRVTLNHRGVFHLNREAAKRLREDDAVTLYFDIHKQVIGLMPAKADRPNAFPLGIKDENLGRVINAISF